MIGILGLGAGFALGTVVPAAGVLLGFPLLLAAVAFALFRHWKLTLLAALLMAFNHRHNMRGPEYTPGGAAVSYGEMIDARGAVRAEVNRTVESRVTASGDGRAVAYVSLRNPSAYATLVVSSVWCTAKAPTDSTSETARVSRRVPPGGSFEHSFRFERPLHGARRRFPRPLRDPLRRGTALTAACWRRDGSRAPDRRVAPDATSACRASFSLRPSTAA
jgi:hypothetical protein